MAVKVLIVEDNPVARSFLCRVVRESFSDAIVITEAGDLESARRHSPDDPSIAQALAVVRGGRPAPAKAAPGTAAGAGEPAATAATATPLEDARVFAGLEGAQEGLLLLDAAGRVLGGALRNPAGDDVTDAVAA